MAAAEAPPASPALGTTSQARPASPVQDRTFVHTAPRELTGLRDGPIPVVLHPNAIGASRSLAPPRPWRTHRHISRADCSRGSSPPALSCWRACPPGWRTLGAPLEGITVWCATTDCATAVRAHDTTGESGGRAARRRREPSAGLCILAIPSVRRSMRRPPRRPRRPRSRQCQVDRAPTPSSCRTHQTSPRLRPPRFV